MERPSAALLCCVTPAAAAAAAPLLRPLFCAAGLQASAPAGVTGKRPPPPPAQSAAAPAIRFQSSEQRGSPFQPAGSTFELLRRRRGSHPPFLGGPVSRPRLESGDLPRVGPLPAICLPHHKPGRLCFAPLPSRLAPPRGFIVPFPPIRPLTLFAPTHPVSRRVPEPVASFSEPSERQHVVDGDGSAAAAYSLPVHLRKKQKQKRNNN